MEYAYATCILNESGAEINETNLTAVLEAAGCEVHESRVKALVAALEDIEIDSAVDFEDLGSGPAQNGEPTGGDPSKPAESDLKDASGMDLVPTEAGDGVDDTGGSNGEFDEEAGAVETDLDETFEERDDASAEEFNGDSAGDSDDDSAGNSDGGSAEDSAEDSDVSVAVPVDEYAEMADGGTETETETESDEV